jgi:hypothetical protein
MAQGGRCRHQVLPRDSQLKKNQLNFTPSVKVGSQIVIDQERKNEVFTQAFSYLLGNIQVREHNIDLHALYIPRAQLQVLQNIF